MCDLLGNNGDLLHRARGIFPPTRSVVISVLIEPIKIETNMIGLEFLGNF
jgi:hypothetical protein